MQASNQPKPTGKKGKENKREKTEDDEYIEEEVTVEDETEEEKDGESDEIIKRKKGSKLPNKEGTSEEDETSEEDDSEEEKAPHSEVACIESEKTKIKSECQKSKGLFNELTCECKENSKQNTKTESEEITEDTDEDRDDKERPESSEREPKDDDEKPDLDDKTLPTTCVESYEDDGPKNDSSESADDLTTKSNFDQFMLKIYLKLIKPLIFLEPCDCTCAPSCKSRKMIIDVLLKYFYKDIYDRNCCEKNCKCDGAKFLECEESSSSKSGLFDVFAKFFKPEGESIKTDDIQVVGKKISHDKQERFSKALKSAIVGLEEVLNS